MAKRKWLAIDLDGTVADCDHRLGYILDMETRKKLPSRERDYNMFYKNSFLDEPIYHMIKMIKDHAIEHDAKLVFITGRPERMKGDSLSWIAKHINPAVMSGDLFMRKENDYRPDGVVKGELMYCAMECMGMEEPVVAYDDRDTVLRVWNKMLEKTHVIDSRTGVKYERN